MYAICQQFQKGCLKSFSLTPGSDSGVVVDLVFDERDFIKFDDEIECIDFRDFLCDYIEDQFFAVEV